MDISQRINQLALSCGSSWAILERSGEGAKFLARVQLRCHSWLCPRCQKVKARQFSKATSLFFKNQRVSILTLTMDRRDDLRTSFQKISGNWNHFRTLLSQKIGLFSFVKVLEPQGKSGYPHFHVLINRFLPSGLVPSLLKQSGFGKIWDIKEISGEAAFFYVRKYLRKSWPLGPALQAVIDFRMRRISGSRGFSLGKSGKFKWKLVYRNLSEIQSEEKFGALVVAHKFANWKCRDSVAIDGWGFLEFTWGGPARAGPPDSFDQFVSEFSEFLWWEASTSRLRGE